MKKRDFEKAMAAISREKGKKDEVLFDHPRDRGRQTLLSIVCS